jgi:hypothetical protein
MVEMVEMVLLEEMLVDLVVEEEDQDIMMDQSLWYQLNRVVALMLRKL